ncbi:hypothetical protein SLS62_003484 [Diatrype stigma]|uniref:Uncharacterized protein n=1 Tax=Diatrype stigma TaxID=117547 RepID=A0AAN9US79_9PEZI
MDDVRVEAGGINAIGGGGGDVGGDMPQRASTPPSSTAASAAAAAAATGTSATNHHLKHTLTPTPLSPKLDHSQIYASPTNILPRRSRGLDFSRAATSLHHSTLAEQSSPDSSPTIGGRAMNIPGRGHAEYSAEQSSNSLWSMMGARERNHLSGSVGSANNVNGSDSSSSSDNDDYMDDEMEDAIMSTPQIARGNMQLGNQTAGQPGVVPWLPDASPAPKTKGFARIRAALAEESMPVDSEVQREAEVIRQVRESDINLELRVPPPTTVAETTPPGAAAPPAPLDIPNLSTASTSPNLNTTREGLDDMTEDDMMTDSNLSSSFKKQAFMNSKGKNFWDTFSETSSINGTRVTPPPPSFLPRGSSSGISEDVNMDSPSAGSATTSVFEPRTGFPFGPNVNDNQRPDAAQQQPTSTFGSQGGIPPTAAEITRRINNKRRRDDDFDPVSFKRRAVSPGMSVHNSPIMQSPMQRDMAPWGSRPGSNHGGDKHSATPSDNGSSAGNNNGGRPISGPKGRVGFQGMVDTNDGLMRMSIE